MSDAAKTASKPSEKPVGPQEPVVEQITHGSLMEAVLAVQAEALKLPTTAVNPHFGNKYVSLAVLMAQTLPLLNKHGLAWMAFPCRDDDGEPILQYELHHIRSGEERVGKMLLLSAKNDPQGQGSAITYARRYSLMAVLGLVADPDDDGNAAAESRRRQQEARHTPLTLSEDQVIRMRNEITQAGHVPSEVYRSLGIAVESEMTPEQAHRVKAFIERGTPS